MASVQEAEQIVRRLTGKYGFLNQKMMDDIEQFNAKYRREIDENWLAMESAVSHSIKILAKQIYGSGARFVFELVQNAEDNLFEKAGAANALPFISFKIYPDKIIVDCNEDGFTEPDLQAICAVGQSSKSATHGYIGAKGIGFKSVFIAASRVHIQSGNFSFEFRHNKTDPGIGMVRPIWVTPAEAIPYPLTRMTLYTHDEGDPDEIEHLNSIISMQFDDLRATCLLFLRKLGQISFEFYGENGELKRSRRFRKHKIDDYRVSLETISTGYEAGTTQRQAYHITRQTATGLARSDNRELPDTEEAKQDFAKAEVVLAFPITANSEALITQENQDLCAFLPLRKSDYKFLIHSDFDTEVHRQNIITTSRRNLDLRGWIASAFFQAVLQFCEHDTLCYDCLNREIWGLMKKTPVLRSRNRIDLRLIGDILILTQDATDAEGRPLFDDPSKDLYLSPRYSQGAKDNLKEYGLKVLYVDKMLELVATDLSSPNSKLQGRDTSEEWHSAVARLFSNLIENSLSTRQKLQALPLLPLRSGGWSSTTLGSVYFPTIRGIDIPGSLDLNVINILAAKNPDRNTLFQHLGVSQATNDQVRASILRVGHSKSMPFEPLKEFLRFLYLTHQIGKPTHEEYAQVYIVTAAYRKSSPHRKDIYLPGTNYVYSPGSLLAPEGASPGLSVDFVHPEHMEGAPERPSSSHPSWERWLCDSIGIRDRLRLVSRDGHALSDTFLYIYEHRSDKFLGLFAHLWSYEKSSLDRNETLRSVIKDLSAKNLCGVNFSTKLKETWLPLKALKELVGRYMERPGQFPFLKIEESDITEPVGSKWNFLCDYFSVSKDDSVDFLLEILRCIQRSYPKPSSDGQTQKVFDLYVAIYAKLAVTNDFLGAKRKVTQFFQDRGILDPNEKDPVWTFSSKCLWFAPRDMVTAHSLRRALGIRNASLDDLVTELTALRDADRHDMSRLRAIYDYLDKSQVPTVDLRAAFERSPLIYCETRHGESGWYKTSDCLWSSETVLRGKAILDECWEAHESFFVRKLGVKLLTLQMVYEELRQSPRSSTEEIKVAILSLNGLLHTEPTRLDPEPIRQAKVFPVRYPNGTVVLSSASVDFAVGDRDKLKMMFCNKIALLDFEMEDVRRLKPLIEWLRLQDRYLSNSVEEKTFISDDSGRPISGPNRDLKRKAYHIARIAATFNSPRYEDNPSGLYELLRTMTVVEVDGISSVLKIFQNRQSFEVPVATANEHIDDSTGRLMIYVPKKRKEQELCFGSVLPRKLAAWLMRPLTSLTDGPVETDAVHALTAIFASRRSVLNDILDDQGILQVSFENEDDDDDDSDEEEEQQAETQENEEQDLQLSNHHGTDDTPSEYINPNQPLVSPRTSPSHEFPRATQERGFTETVVATISRQSHISYQPAPEGMRHSSRPVLVDGSSRSPNDPDYRIHSNLPPTSAALSEHRSSEEASYRVLLERVVEKARGAPFPSRGSFDMSDMRNALSGAGDTDTYDSFDGLDILSRARSNNQLERDKKVGAAGELYVFELLSRLEMPHWALANWKSTIRSYVAVHPNYTGLLAWSGSETADLVYDDTEGHLTNVLIGCGYLDHDEWHSERPKYYIEVKTTTGPCGTAFYMSGKQYDLMRRIHYKEDHSEIYIIFRVFWLNSDRISLCVYTDPEQLKQDGRLLFRGQTWSVTPGSGTVVDG